MNRLINQYIPFFSLVISLFACMACTRIEEKRFLFETELTVQQRFPIYEAFSPMRMHIHHDYLILIQSFNPYSPVDHFYQAYRLSDLEYAGSFGRRGRGPDEWLNPDFVLPSSASPFLYLCEMSSRQPTAVIHKMAIDSLAQLTEIGSFSVEKGYCAMSRPVIRDDSLLVFDEFTPDIRALRVHHLLEEHPVVTWKYETSVSPNQYYLDENRGFLRANDSGVIFIYAHKNMIDFMDWELKLKKRLNYQKGKPIMHENPLENKIYYAPSFLGEHFLYAFFFDMSENERKTKNTLHLALEVFDMHGTPVYRYTFSEPTPTAFTVDERTFTLYGYQENGSMEDFISVYHLPGLKEYLQNR